MDQSCQIERQQCPLDSISASVQSLETVRALHQTVVSLRTALEDAHREIDQLKKQILIHADIDQGRVYRQHYNAAQQQIEEDKQATRLETLDTFAPIVYTTKNPDATPNDLIDNNIKEETATKPIFDSLQFKGETERNTEREEVTKPSTKSKHVAKKFEYELPISPIEKRYAKSPRLSTFTPEIKIITDTSSIKKHKQMASKIDVKIKVTSNLKLNESNSDTQTDTNSGSESLKDSDQSQSEDLKSPRNGGGSENIEIKSTENITIVQNDGELATTKISTENIVAENLSATSLSEEETSVFEEENTEEVTEPNDNVRTKKQVEKQSTGEHHEEVDDIELIFSSDDKEFPQEDLVSISEYEPWAKVGTSGTPVLVNFADIHSDQEHSKNLVKEESEDNGMNELNEANNIIQENLNQEISIMEGISSPSGADYNRSSFDTSIKSPSLDKGNSSDNLVRRDESFDTFDQVSSTSGMGKRWTNLNVLIETDISKCGIAEENILDLSRRNTCPNPPPYRPIIHREALGQIRHTSARCPFASKLSRANRPQNYPNSRSPRPILVENNKVGPKRSSSAQTEISALPEHWRSESHLAGGRFHSGLCTLPSKFIPPPGMNCYRYPHLRISDRTQEVRRALLSDINFTSMVPELSRSADHLCQEEDQTNENSESLKKDYYKGNQLNTPDYSRRGLTPSFSMTSPGVSQWTVNENSFGTQTTQTENYWGVHGDSFDSSKSYSIGSKYSSTLDKSHRSRSVPSIRCAICKQNHGLGLRASESMHYTPRVTFQEPNRAGVRGSLPDLRKECTCSSRRYGRSMLRILGDSSGSTESLLDEADDFLRKSMDAVAYDDEIFPKRPTSGINARRCSENDIKKDYTPSKQSLPFLPKSPKCLKLGHLAKVITKTDRVVIGRVRYIGPLAFNVYTEDEVFVGLQLPNKVGDCDGSIDGRKFFECEPQHGIFVPFKKIVMAWTA